MHRRLIVALLCMLAPVACAADRTPRAPEPSEVEAVDEGAEIKRWFACHPQSAAQFEFAKGETRITLEAADAEIERLVARWEQMRTSDNPIVKVLILGYRNSGEFTSIDDLRAEGVRSALIEAGAASSLLLAAGFDVPGRTTLERFEPNLKFVTVLECSDSDLVERVEIQAQHVANRTASR
jgi:hypothetical protein